MLIELKKGNKIYIKPKNRGKFTEYCHGKVTDECILKGKNSSNPAIRKRATFAANARKWKHLMGGSLNYAEWEQMTPELKLTYRTNRAKAYINENLSIGNLWNAAKTYLGGNDPENPNLNQMIVDVPLPGNFSLLSKALQNWKYLLSLVNSGKLRINPTPALSKGFSQANEITVGRVSLPLTGLTVRKAKPINLTNPITTKAELLAAMDYNATVNPSQRVNTSLPTGRPSVKIQDADGNLVDIRYPKKPILLTSPLTTIIKNNKLANLTSHERYLQKRDFTKKLRTTDKYARAFNSGDNRPLNSGQSKMRNKQYDYDWELMKHYHPYSSTIEKWELKMAKALLKRNPEQIKLLNKLRKELIEEYRKLFRFKVGGKLFSFLEGGKTSFWQKAGNFLNGETGLLSLGALIFGGLKTGSDIADFSNSFDLATDSKVKAMDSKMRAASYLNGLQKAKETIALKQLENPNVRYGEIDLMKMAQDFSKEFYDSEAIDNYKTLRALEKLLLMQAIQGSASSGLTDIIQNGLGMVGNFLNNKKSTTPTTTTSDNITLSLLNYSTIGKSTNPYMYTGLGANYNAKTLFS